MDDLVGQTLGQYRVDALIGLGGMARVYRAYQQALDRNVAIKAIPTRVDNVVDSDFVRQFNTEARLIARLAHPHIVPVHDFGETPSWAYIVMEYLAGGTVRDRFVQAETQHLPLNLTWVLNLLEQAAHALDFAHTNGVVHRDVKPANMLLRSEDQLLLSDFGIATILAASKAASRTQTPVGTPQYMAPEQGTPHGKIDGRTDIYALGIVLFQAVTGRLPFTGESPIAIIMKQIHEPLPRPSALAPGLPPSVEHIIQRAAAKDPAARYQRAAEMASELRAANDELRLGVRRYVPTMPRGSVQAASNPVYLANQQVPMPARVVTGPISPVGICFRCGTPNNPANHFCTSCGYDLSGARARNDHVRGKSGQPLRCRILFRNGALAGRAFVLHQDTTTLGRTNKNDIVVPGGTVSRFHAKLTFSRGRWLIEDLKSSNGTFVNGARVQKPKPLGSGDEVRLGDEILTFDVLE